jgi:FlgN protein
VSLSDISNALLREQALLEMLLFKLEEEHFILAAGRTRWLAAATREVEAVLGEIRRCELVRATLVAAVAPSLGLASNPSLRELAEAAPEPWDFVLDQHRRSFLEIADDIGSQANANKQLLNRGATATKDLLERAARERSAGRPGARSHETSFLVDQAL